MRDLFDITMTMDYELLDITMGRLKFEQLDIKKEINRVEEQTKRLKNYIFAQISNPIK